MNRRPIIAEETLLRPVALWAADCAGQALPVFLRKAPDDRRPWNAVIGAREFGKGKRRDKALRMLAWAAQASANDAGDKAAEYAARSAMLAAAVAYTHTDLIEGIQGVRQARHLLGPAVYAGLSLELEAGEPTGSANDFIYCAAESAPPEARELLRRMPTQRPAKTRLGRLFHAMDARLRSLHR